MLNEERARSATYEAKTRTARVDVRHGGGAPKEASGTVLLDARGAVVGVDIEPDAPSRIVVMVGAHEAVASTAPARLQVSRDAKGDVAHVLVHDVAPPR